jgi:hypothetical protein
VTTAAPEKTEARKRPVKSKTEQEQAVEQAVAAEQTEAATKAPPKNKKVEAMETWIAALKKMPADGANEKYPTLTNSDVVKIAEYQVMRAIRAKGADLTPAEATALRAAASVHPKLLDSALSDSEKEALVDWQKGELSKEQSERAKEKPGLSGKARFLWVVHGKTTAEQAKEADKPAKEKKPRATKPKRWREGTFAPLTEDVTGALAFLCEGDPHKGDPLILVGQFGDDEFYEKVQEIVKKRKMDEATVQIVTLRGRYARCSTGPAKDVEKAAA